MIASILRKLLTAEEGNRDKFRKIKLSNPKVHERIVQFGGGTAIGVLLAAGWRVVKLPTPEGDIQDYLYYPSDNFRILEYTLSVLEATGRVRSGNS